MNRMMLAMVIVGSAGLAASAQAAGDAAAGKTKATACVMCHGPDGAGTQVAPKLAGEDPAKFIQALQDYKSGKRDNAMMKAQVASLTPADMANLAAYYAAAK